MIAQVLTPELAQPTTTNPVVTRLLGERYAEDQQVTLYPGDTLDLLRQLPPKSARLIVTSPPYNLGKIYEKRIALDEYLSFQAQVIAKCAELLTDDGSICWQVGNFVQKKGASEVVPLDIVLYPIFAKLGLRLRNRIIWHFEHGLHSKKRFSGRYETILWFTKGDHYVFDLDPVRVPSKYPGKKYYKGPKVGQYSCNPLGKNPGDVWAIPNVKNNHVEKTGHPCQYPVELIERLVLSMTKPNDLIVDPFVGVGTTAVAAVRHQRRCAGADFERSYIETAKERVELAAMGELRTRPMGTPIYVPPLTSKLLRRDE